MPWERGAHIVVRSRPEDDDPTVRKVAGWYSRGGPIYERLRPRPLRRSKAAQLSA